MAITKVSNSSLKNLNKYDSFLAGNAAYNPGATFFIQRVTATGGEVSLSFTSIPSTYKHLQIRGISRDTASGGNPFTQKLQFNSDTAANYSSHYISTDIGYSPSVTAFSNTSVTYNLLNRSSASADATSGVFGGAIIDILDYSSTSKAKTIRAFLGVDSNNTINNFITLESGAWYSTSAINRIDILCGFSGFAAGTTFALYGFKG